MPFASLASAAAEEGHELPVPPLVFGVGAFVFLTVLLLITLALGKGRPHA